MTDFAAISRVQYGYVVPDIRAAMTDWADTPQVKTWVWFEESMGDRRYVQGGRVSNVRVATALTRLGAIEIELIQPLSDGLSIFHDSISDGNRGLHHIGTWTAEADGLNRALIQSGMHEVARIDTASGDRDIQYLAQGESGVLLELIPWSAQRQFMSKAVDALLQQPDGQPFQRFASPAELARTAIESGLVSEGPRE